MTEQIRRQRKEMERMGIAKRHTERGREQAGMSREGQRTMEKVLENTVRDTGLELAAGPGPGLRPGASSKYSLW